MAQKKVVMQRIKAMRDHVGMLGLASGVLTVIMCAVLVFAALQRNMIKTSLVDQGDSLAGLVFQFDRELLRLGHALNLELQHPEQLDREALSLRYDILNSRVALLKDSPIMAEIAMEAEYTNTLMAMETLNRRMDKVLAAQRISLAELADIERFIYRVEAPVQSLIHEATVKTSHNMEVASGILLKQNELIVCLTLLQMLFLIVATRSIAHRKKQQELAQKSLQETTSHLQRNEAKLILAANVFKFSRESIVVADAQGVILEVNENFCNTTQYEQSDLNSVHMGALMRRWQPANEGVQEWLQIVNTKGHWLGEVVSRRKDGSEYPAMVSISAVHDAQGALMSYTLFFNDITDLKQKQRQLEYIAHYDLLTGLVNRTLLLEQLRTEIVSSSRNHQAVAVAFLDLDGFKAINDSFGHAAGDQLLVGLAAQMKLALRAGDCIARFGGDEFVILVTGLDQPEDCIPVLERLLEAASTAVPFDGQMLRVSGSIGVTVYPNDDFDAEQLVRHADQAMYLAKQSGKGQFAFFDTAREREIKEQMATMPEVKLGLERSEFVLYYQPKVNMKTGETVGVEGLIRWLHPVRGILTPAAFLPQIEGRPISLELSKWVIATAIQQIQTWLEEGISLPISVNVGALHLQQTSFYSEMRELVLANPSCKGMLLIEILETAALSDMTRIRETLQQCQALGIDFALDDFGTGYSSLTYLSHLPAQELKIDQSFVRQMIADRNQLSIVEGVVSLAHAFRRTVIAEGIESEAEGALLLQLGCDLGQGYHIARPMPAPAIPGWLASWQPPVSWTKQVYVPKDPSTLLNDVIRTAPIGVAMIDFDGLFENVNAAYCAIYGYDRSELIGASFGLIFAPEERELIMARHKKFLLDGGDLGGVWKVMRKDGAWITVTTDSVRVPGNNDAARRLVYVLTERSDDAALDAGVRMFSNEIR